MTTAEVDTPVRLPHPDDIFTTRQLAAYLRVHPETIKNWISRGELEAILIGGSGGYKITGRAVRKRFGAPVELP